MKQINESCLGPEENNFKCGYVFLSKFLNSLPLCAQSLLQIPTVDYVN